MSSSATFYFAYVSSPTNIKSSVHVVKSIRLDSDSETYYFPPEAQPIILHDALAKVPTVARNIAAMNKRGQFRNLTIKLSDELKKVYVDEEGNVQFRNYFLQSDEPSIIQEQHSETETDHRRSLQSVTKDMVLTKYANKNQNADVWLKTFNRECDRLNIIETRRAEAMRLFLEKTPLDWFTSQWITNSDDTWQNWSANFLEAFGDKGWDSIWFSINFRWLSGTSFSEYVIKKNCLLVESLPDMSEKNRVALIAVGLPREVREKIDKNFVTTQGRLLSEVTKWESVSGSNGRGRKNVGQTEEGEKDKKNNKSKKSKNPDYKPCILCEKKGFKDRYHHINECWNNPNGQNYGYKERFGNKNSDKPIKVANNTELEGLFNELNQKN